MLKLLVGKVIFTVLIAKFKLRRFYFLKSFLDGIKCISVLNERRALIVVTFIDRAILTVLPKIKSMAAMRTPEFSFASKAMMKVE